MIDNQGAIVQTILGTLFTWGLTALGAGLVFIFSGTQRKVLDGSLGFAAGVMVAASYWSLLSPAIELAEQSGMYGAAGELAFVPIAVGFFLGSLFVYMVDVLMADHGLSGHLVNEHKLNNKKFEDDIIDDKPDEALFSNNTSVEGFCKELTNRRRKRVASISTAADVNETVPPLSDAQQWKRIMLLVIAITVHNIPEGMAVGVGFGAIGVSPLATFNNARNLAFGIGIQNFPEGLAVSLPLKAAGYSVWKSFWYGQLSGMVEPIAGIVGALMVTVAEPTLPYALSFAAGAMIYVVIDDIIPEAHSSGNGRLATWCCVAGFLVMMALDVGLG